MHAIKTLAMDPRVLVRYGIRTRVHLSAALANAMGCGTTTPREDRLAGILIDLANVIAIHPRAVALLFYPDPSCPGVLFLPA